MENDVILQGFEWYLPDDGNHYNKLKQLSESLSKVGFNAIWLPPFCKATGTNDVGYGIYDLYDLGEFDQKGSVRTKYGTKEELKSLINTLHKYNISVYGDIILNHKAGADEEELFKAVQVSEEDRLKELSQAHDIKGWTKFTFDNRGGKYSRFIWHFQHFSGVDYDSLNDKKGIFKIVGEGKKWEKDVSYEKGNYDYLMFADIDHNHPDVRRELFNWGNWIIEELNLDGMRFDALKHIGSDFIVDFIERIRSKENIRDDFYLFGEYWLYEPNTMNGYLYDTKYDMDLFDVGLHYNLLQASKDTKYDIRKVFDNTLVKEHPTIAVTFVDNHDSQPGQALESYVADWFKKIAYGIILLHEDGYPCVFWGDYMGMGEPVNSAGHKDMIENLMYIRKKFAYGDMDMYYESENLLGWVRRGNEKHPKKLAVLISTGDMNSLKMFVGKEEAGKTYKEYTGDNTNEIVIDDEGFGEFEVGPGTITCWSEKDE
ncbi:MAG: alpha-amylase [Lagierella massiliensis]|nr:alpha-amylase [Lagierella massiliensis]